MLERLRGIRCGAARFLCDPGVEARRDEQKDNEKPRQAFESRHATLLLVRLAPRAERSCHAADCAGSTHVGERRFKQREAIGCGPWAGRTMSSRRTRLETRALRRAS